MHFINDMCHVYARARPDRTRSTLGLTRTRTRSSDTLHTGLGIGRVLESDFTVTFRVTFRVRQYG